MYHTINLITKNSFKMKNFYINTLNYNITRNIFFFPKPKILLENRRSWFNMDDFRIL